MLGTVIYELLIGRPPFYSEDFGELYQNIKKGSLCFPSKLSKEVKNLITVINKIMSSKFTFNRNFLINVQKKDLEL